MTVYTVHPYLPVRLLQSQHISKVKIHNSLELIAKSWSALTKASSSVLSVKDRIEMSRCYLIWLRQIYLRQSYLGRATGTE